MHGSEVLGTAMSHAIQIAIVAAVVAILTRTVAKHRPHLAHALWALVLLKCLTPPIIASPTSPFSWWNSSSATPPANLVPPEKAFEGNTPRIFYSVERTTTDRTTLSPATDSTQATRSVSDQSSRWCDAVLRIWIASCCGWLIYHLLRFRGFAVMVDRTRIEAPAFVQSQLEDLRQQLGIRTRVQLCVVDSLVGPAIMGLFHPRLIVPRIIVEQVDPAQLRILLAHELIHVRRGDLWWSCLHVIARSWWWFHPVVWLTVNRQSQEAEDCCDAETIRGLRCTPAHYARSLISVLETKQQLAAAPFVPGLRPIDITSLRMEKIMRSGQGNHARTPLSVHGCLLLGALVALPGAAWLRGQEPVAEQAVEALPPLPPTAPPAPTTISPGVSKDGKSTAPQELFTIDVIVLEMPAPMVQTFLKTSREDDAQSTDRPAPVKLAAARNGDINMAEAVYSDLGVEGQVITNHPWLLSSQASDLVNDWIREHQAQGVKVLQRPRLCMEASQSARVQVGEERPFVIDIDPSTGQPKIEVAELGLAGEFVIEVVNRQANQASDTTSADAYLSLSYKLSRSSLKVVKERQLTLADGRLEKVQHPVVSTTSLERNLNVPHGVTIADPLPRSSADEPITLFVINVERMPKSDVSTSLTSPEELGFPVQRRNAYGKVELRQAPPVTRDPKSLVQAGDILLLHARILSSQTPYSIQKGSENKAPAYPIAVLEDGTISLPLLARIHVEELTIEEIERKVADAYVAAEIVKEDDIEVIFAKRPKIKD